ncbi:hypothetical protein LG943_08385 [Streptomonospora sp. S1-112]|uniref:Uncharacterized protein n=1 Tax=Streptomonospora mangrovi TaxID=2883123 RepID=A0A9X3SDW9_9ACTN|nr:hypothetical protein [Streptomonospora mangrovi]MDA0564342.1 hypothetical protein [Streptomonospora mangrovi]
MALEAVREPDAARRAMARGEALAGVVGAPLEFAGARPDAPGPVDADADEGRPDVFVAVALWTAATGAEHMPAALERLHEHWRAHGADAVLRPLGRGGARVSARDADGFAYTAESRQDRAGIVLRVVTPRYTNPEPGRPFVGIFAQGEVPPPEAGAGG